MKQITTLDDLRKAARDRKSLYCCEGGVFSRPSPAAWFYNMQAWWVHRWLDRGLYIYKPKPKRSWFKTKEALRIARKASPEQPLSSKPIMDLFYPPEPYSSGTGAIQQLLENPMRRKFRSSKKQTHG
jgi:hypothetical protein